MHRFSISHLVMSMLILICLSACFLFGSQITANRQSTRSDEARKTEINSVPSYGERRTGRHVNFDEERELKLGNNASTGQPVALVSADFDSDGLADVVTADTAGNLQLLKGVDPAVFAIDPTKTEQAKPEPFSAIATGTSLGFSPDYLFAGDFNADGKQDIIGATKGANSIVLVTGDGRDNFSQPSAISVNGNITAIDSGEIGKPDGQADLAITYVNKEGSFLAVYEHPESAFKHPPEIIKLPSAANALALGNTDEDFYADIAVACGSSLVIVHERGQAYPWDIVNSSGIERPPAVVDVRRMPFSIASMAVSRFGQRRGTSLAMLAGDANIYRLEPTRKIKASDIKIPASKLIHSASLPFAPTGADTSKYAMLDQKSDYSGQTTDEAGNLLVDTNEITSGREDYIRKRSEENAKSVKQYSPDEIARIKADGMIKRVEMDVRQKEAFIKTISARTSLAKDWKIEMISAGSQFASAANGNGELTRLNVSDSNLDDLMVTAKGSGEIQFVSRQKNDNGNLRTEVSSVSAVSGVRSVLPTRLNLDGLDDLVVLHEASASPSVVMTAPSALFAVNTTDDNTVCQTYPDPCSLRGAILAANANPGNNIIAFALPAGTQISPQSPLPSINRTMSLQSGHPPDGTRGVEISGTNAGPSVDGLKIRASNVFIYSLAVSGFRSTTIGGGQVGGNGIVIASDSGAPNIGNNSIQECFLGTDATGNLDRGNDATGVLIFDSDNNGITGSLLSGNGGTTTGGYGIGVTDGNSNNFTNNIIGLNAAGNAKLGNTAGMLLTGANNSIGGDFVGAGNTISGNGRTDPNNPGQCTLTSYYFASGISTATLVSVDTGAILTQNNSIVGNFIGTNPGGTLPMGNCYGAINTSPIHQTTIGSITQTGRNIVSDNGFNAIACTEEYLYGVLEGGYCAIAGNTIGTDVSGTTAMPNNDRNYEGGIDRARGTVEFYYSSAVSYFGAPGGTSPGQCTGFCNLYSSNNPGVEEGIYFTGGGIMGYFNNYIGTNAQGNQPLGNTRGIDIGGTSAAVYVGGVGTDSGGGPVSLGNLISGNTTALGAFTNFSQGNSSTLTIQGNRVGTDITGIFAIPNGDNGYPGNEQPAVAIIRGLTEPTLIGGADPLARNIISGNDGDGIIISSGFNSGIFNNLIGVSSSLAPLGNGGNGISARSNFMQIGGGGTLANQIAYNGSNSGDIHAGVAVLGGGTDPAMGVTVRGNSIHDNNGLGIDLGVRDPHPGFNQFLPDGVTDNDCLDGDFGPNGLQNFPVLLSYASGGSSIIGYLRGTPSEDFKLDFYSNTGAEPGTHHGEGAVPIGTLDVSTNGSGFTSFEFTLPQQATELITATATDSFGNTSEFSCDVGACTDPVRPVNSKEDVDEIYSTSICADPIIVNVEGDADDEDLLDETCDIDGAQPGPQCTLRAAIQEAENQPGANTILFNIPGGGVHTLLPGSVYPVLNQPVTIDATSQPGYVDRPLILIDGSGLTNAYGLSLRGGSSTVKGLSIVNFKEQIGITGSGGGSQNRIGANYIGVRPDGSLGDMTRQQFGISIVGGATNNQIGGYSAGNYNVIGGNGEGISINTNSTNNNVINNYVGIAADGVTPIANRDGIVVRDSSANNIGGYINDKPNVVSFNTENGIRLLGATSNRVSGNLIGTTKTGDAPAGNKTGVNIDTGSANNIVGGTSINEKNVISGQNATNNSVGVIIRPDAGTFNTVAGNYLGVSLNGDIGLPNRIGIAVNADNQYIGNAGEGDYRNLIVSDDTDGGYGIYLHPFSPNDVLENVIVQNNTIGTLSFSNAASGEVGIYLTGDVNNCTVNGNTVGHQSFAGIRLFDGPHNNTISGNRVGIKTTNEAIPNYNGIAIRQADTNFVRDNTVSGNTNNGIVIGDSFGQNDRPAPLVERARVFGANSFATNNIVTGNRVGTDVDSSYLIPNGQVAIGVGLNVRDSRIGGPGAEGNIVGGSTGADWPFGIFVGTINDAATDTEIPHNIKVQGNRVGVGPESNQANLANGYGIYIRNAANTTVGGDTQASGNIVGFNLNDGIRLFKPLTTDTTVQNNFVGVLTDGSVAANAGDGISIEQAEPSTLSYNVVGGNQGNGIHVVNVGSTLATKKGGNRPNLFSLKLVGNLSGVFPANGPLGEMAKVANQMNGILMDEVFNAQLGEIGAAATELGKNILSGNVLSGLAMNGGQNNTVSQAIAGTDHVGTLGLGNGVDGMAVVQSLFTQIENTTASGNGRNGLTATDIQPNPGDPPSIRISGGLFGVSRILGQSLASCPNGVIGAAFQDVNGLLMTATDPLHPNLIGANKQIGLLLQGTLSKFNKILGTNVGTDENGGTAYANGRGVVVDGASNTSLGEAGNPLKVVINKNLTQGLTVQGVEALFNNLKNSEVRSNGSHGILLRDGANNNVIGGQEVNAGNLIAENGESGVWIDPTAGAGNVIDPNTIFGNGGLGIDIGSPGHTANDPGDADEGPNRGQNYPDIVSYSVNGNGELTVSYRVDTDVSSADYPLYVEFFIADESGEGKTFLAYDSYSGNDHDSSGGVKTANLGLASDRGWASGDLMTASATDGGNNTSEFFPAVPQATPTATGTATETPTVNPTNTPENSPTNTATATATSTATLTPTPTSTDTPTNTPTTMPTPPVGIRGTVNYDNAIGAPAKRPVPNVLLTGSGSSGVSAITDASGNYALTGFGTGAYTITPSKNGGTNAAISSFDAARVAQHVVGSPMPQLSGNQLVVADVSGNGEITSFDAAEIASYVVSVPPYGSTGSWKFTPTSNFHSSVNSDIAGEDYAALLLGDVSGNWNDPSSLPGGRSTIPYGPMKNISVTAPHISTRPDSDILISLQVDGVANRGIIAYQFDLLYDPQVIRPLENVVDLTNGVSRSLTAVFNSTEPGRLRVAVYGPMPVNENGTLLTLRFRSTGLRGSMSPIQWEQVIFNEGEASFFAVDGEILIEEP